MTFRAIAILVVTALALAACRELTIYPMVDGGGADDDCDAEPCESADASTD